MARFQVTTQAGFWDGVQLHPKGTIFEIDPKTEKNKISMTFEGLDDDARAAVAALKQERYGAKVPDTLIMEHGKQGGPENKLDPTTAAGRKLLQEQAQSKTGVKAVGKVEAPPVQAVRPGQGK